jgi:type II secretory pathway component PulK
MLIRALSIITALTLLAVWGAVANNMAERKDKKARDAKANTAVNQVKTMLEALASEVEAMLPRYNESNLVERANLKADLREVYNLKGRQIENGSVRDIYLTSVDQIITKAFTVEA